MRNFTLPFFNMLLENRQIIIALRLETKRFRKSQNRFNRRGEKEKEKGEKKTMISRKKEKNPQVKQTGLDHK
jgi:hypothetical protein